MSDAIDFGIDLEDVRKRFLGMGYFLSVTDIQAASEALSDPDAFGFLPPAAFVSIASETAEPNKTIGGHAQRVNVLLSMLFAIPSARADREADDEVEQVKRAVIRMGVAWKPKGAGAALDYSRYVLRATGGGLVWGEVLFSTSYQLRV
jgi:hypothetical protein